MKGGAAHTLNRRRTLLLLAAVLLCAGGGLFLYQTGFFESASSVEGLRAYIARFAPYSHLWLFVVQFLSVVLAPIPSNITSVAGGLGRDFADRLVSRKLSEKYQAVLETKAPIFLTLAFLFPFFPDDILCILAGLTRVSWQHFLVIVLLARPWGLLFACALGGSTISLPLWAMVPIGLAGLALFLLGMKYGDRIEAAVLARLQARRRRDR